jgi:putative nucleotidyltransferase with HDIG domain
MKKQDEKWSFDIAEEANNTGIIPWNDLLRLFPILLQLEKVEQNPHYHKEGNVLNHTKMVLEQLVVRGEWKKMDPYKRSVLMLSALFHDVGKMNKTIDEEGVLSSKGHSADGARMIRHILWDFNGGYKVPFLVREYVSSMSLLHMLPMYLFEKENPLYSVCASSYTVCNEDLRLLSISDILGRICDSNKKAMETNELFGMFCEENGCLNDRRFFLSDHSRFLYFFERKGHPDLNRYHDCKGTVHMMSGLPGAGKDYYIHNNLSSLPVVGLDDIREEMDVKVMENEGGVSQLAKERCRENMRKGQDFVFNATNLLKVTRARWIRLFNSYNYRIQIHYIEPSFDVLMKQNLNRDKPVPEDVVKRMFTKLEPPTLLECHDISFSC